MTLSPSIATTSPVPGDRSAQSIREALAGADGEQRAAAVSRLQGLPLEEIVAILGGLSPELREQLLQRLAQSLMSDAQDSYQGPPGQGGAVSARGGGGGQAPRGAITPSRAQVSGAPDPGKLGKLSAEQRQNAQIIIDEGKKAGAGPRDIQIALMTAMQESNLRNLPGGDRDSAGLFQQRPSCGWGSYAQVTDPHYAARTFYQHLLRIPNRDQLQLTEAAQQVQRSAFPNAYAKWSGLAAGLLAQSGSSLG